MYAHLEVPKTIRSGFTLIEIMIVVAVIGILAAIAIPDFMRLASKAKQAEAKSHLGAIFVAQMVYFGENGVFAGKTNSRGEDAFEQIGWVPESLKATRYCYLLDEALLCGVTRPASLPSPIPSSSAGFTAIAAGNIDNDAVIDIWTINNNRALRNTSPDP